MAFYPYLNFGGNCREAFTRYQQIFGGELVLLPMSDMPGGDVPEGQGDLIMHAALMIGDGEALLMASDAQGGDLGGPVHGMYVNYSTPDAADAEAKFKALAEGGQVEMPISPSFFSPAFGICRDRFGTPWMVVAEQPQDRP